MKLVRVARNVILASLAWRYIARRRALARQRRRSRRLIAPALLAGGAGAVWMARRRIAGAFRALDVAKPAVERPGDTVEGKESQPSTRKAATSGDGKAATRPMRATRATAYGEPAPSPKKRRRRVRRARAEEREKAERQSAKGGKVNVEINETPELRAPLGDLKH